MKNRALLLGLIVIFLSSISFISASSVYNWRYQGPSNQPSTSYYSGYWNSYTGGDSGGSPGYVPISQKLKTFNGPYTPVHQMNTAPYPRSVSTPTSESHNFQNGGGYTPGYSGDYGYYGSYGYSDYGFYGGYYSGYYGSYGYSSYDYLYDYSSGYDSYDYGYDYPSYDYGYYPGYYWG